VNLKSKKINKQKIMKILKQAKLKAKKEKTMVKILEKKQKK